MMMMPEAYPSHFCSLQVEYWKRCCQGLGRRPLGCAYLPAQRVYNYILQRQSRCILCVEICPYVHIRPVLDQPAHEIYITDSETMLAFSEYCKHKSVGRPYQRRDAMPAAAIVNGEMLWGDWFLREKRK